MCSTNIYKFVLLQVKYPIRRIGKNTRRTEARATPPQKILVLY